MTSDETNKRAKRGHGEGSYRQLENSAWQGRVTLPDGGRRSAYAKTERQAREKGKEAIKKAEAGVKLPMRAAHCSRVDAAAAKVNTAENQINVNF